MPIIDPVKTKEIFKRYNDKMIEEYLQLLERRNDGLELSPKEDEFVENYFRVLMDFIFLREPEPTNKDWYP